MVKDGKDFLVYDAKTGDDIMVRCWPRSSSSRKTRRARSALPTTFLRQLIRFYGDSMQMVVPKYLEQSSTR